MTFIKLSVGVEIIRFDEKMVNRLAHFVPGTNDVSSVNKGELLISAIYNAKSSVGIKKLKKIINNDYGINIHSNELNKLIDKLLRENIIIKGSNKYELSPKYTQKISNSISEEEKLTEKVLDEWVKKDILPKYPDLETKQILDLKKQLVLFLKNLFIKHGIESLSLIMPDIKSSKDNLNLQSVITNLSTNKSNSNKLNEIESVEFPNFFSYDNIDRKMFILNLVDKAFRYLTIVCDPEILKSIKKQLKNKVIYLDSNVVYRLVNLQGMQRKKSIEEVISICQKYDIELRISYKTLNELQRRLNYDAKVLKKYPVPRNLASVGIKYLTQENYVSTYWYESTQNNISVEDFIEHYKHIDLLLEEENIIVEKEAIDNESEFEENINKIESQIRLDQNPNADYQKSDMSIRHDAYNLAMVNYLRGDSVYNFLDSNTWFMTTDHSLISFQDNNYHMTDIPIAILPSQLVQMLRVVTPANKEFDEAFIDLFSRAITPTENILSNENIQEILSRIGKYKGSSKIAERILMDKLFRKRYINCESEGEKDELIHDALTDKIMDIENEMEEVNKKAEREKNLKEKFKNKLKSTEGELNFTKETVEYINGEKNQLAGELESERSLKNKVIRWSIVLFLFFVIASGEIIYLTYMDWDFNLLTPFIKTILIAIIPIYFGIASLVLFGEKTFGKLTSMIMFVIGVAKTIYDFFK